MPAATAMKNSGVTAFDWRGYAFLHPPLPLIRNQNVRELNLEWDLGVNLHGKLQRIDSVVLYDQRALAIRHRSFRCLTFAKSA